MIEPFIQNHQYNALKRQIDTLQRAYNTVADRKVIDAVKYSAESHIAGLFNPMTEEQSRLLEPLLEHKSKIEYENAISVLTPYLLSFPSVTEAQIKKLFPKVKKLKVPDLTEVSFGSLTYLGWLDIGSTKLYMVYKREDRLVGVEARYTAVNKKSICSLCNGYGEVALVTAVAKTKASSFPDYYKAVGNYICVDSAHCNKQITDISYLETFIGEIVG